jgi:hypothetical protein
MLQCWKADVDDRPDFTHIKLALERMIENSKESDYFLLQESSNPVSVYSPQPYSMSMESSSGGDDLHNLNYVQELRFPEYGNTLHKDEGYEVPIRHSPSSQEEPELEERLEMEDVPMDPDSYPPLLADFKGDFECTLETLPPVFHEEIEGLGPKGQQQQQQQYNNFRKGLIPPCLNSTSSSERSSSSDSSVPSDSLEIESELSYAVSAKRLLPSSNQKSTSNAYHVLPYRPNGRFGPKIRPGGVFV